MARSDASRAWEATAVLAASAAVQLPGLLIGPSLDAAAFDVVGWRLSQGAPLYAGIWDHKPPGTYLIAWLAQLPGVLDPWVVMWLASVLAVAATGLLVGAVVRRAGLAGMSALIALLITLASGQYLVSLGGGLAEQPATALAGAAVLVAMGQASWQRRMLTGGLLAAGAVVSVQVAPAGAALLVFAASDARPMRSMAAILIGGVSVIVVVVVGLLVTGVGPAARDAFLAYNAAYRGAASSNAASLSVVPWAALALVPLVALAAAGLLALRRWPEARPMAWASTAWIALGAVLLVIQGRFYAHYAIPLIVPLGALAGIGLADIVQLSGKRRSLRLPMAIASSLLLLVAGSASVAGGLQEARTWGAANGRAEAVAAELTHDTVPGSTIWVWGNEPNVYRLSQRAPALRYPYLFPLTTPGYATPALINEQLSRLEAAPPAFVIDAGSLAPGEPGLPPLLIARPTASEGRDLDLLEPLRDFVRERYRLLKVVDGWPIYALNRDS